jgi:hypothetical protein
MVDVTEEETRAAALALMECAAADMMAPSACRLAATEALTAAAKVREKSMVPDEVEQLVATIRLHEEREAKLAEALRFYRDQWDVCFLAYCDDDEPPIIPSNDFIDDQGARARATLKELGYE